MLGQISEQIFVIFRYMLYYVSVQAILGRAYFGMDFVDRVWDGFRGAGLFLD